MNKIKQIKKLTLLIMIFTFMFGLSSMSLADNSNIISKQVYVKGPTFGTNPDDGSASQVRLYFDYNWLAEDETVYNSQLANALALLTVNSYSDSYVASTDSDENINKPELALELLGLEDIKHYVYIGEDINTEDVNDFAGVTIGYKKVTLSDGNQVNVVIAVSDTTEGEKEWLSNFDIGADTDDYYASEGASHSKWENKLNHKGFEVSAVREKSMIDDYLTDYTDHSLKTKLVICGHSRGGALANILGAKYLDEANDNYDIFTYTFGTPNTTEIKGDNTENKLFSYKSIFNHVNYDDFVTWIPSFDWGFSRYGSTIELRFSDSDEMMKKFDDLCWYNVTSGYKYPVMEGMMGVGDSFASMFESREDI